MFYRLEFELGSEWVGYWRWMKDHFNLDNLTSLQYTKLEEEDWFIEKYSTIPCWCKPITSELRETYRTARCWFTQDGYVANYENLRDAKRWAEENGVPYRYHEVKEVPGTVIYEDVHQVFVCP